MELGYETLCTACTAILLSFLVSRLVSLILSCSSPADDVSTKEIKRVSAVDHDRDDEGEHKKLLKTAINAGQRLSKVRSSGCKKKNKSFKFVGPSAKVAELGGFDDVFIKDIEVVSTDGGILAGFETNAFDFGEFGNSGFVGIRETGGEGGIKNMENVEVNKKLADWEEEGNQLVGYEGDDLGLEVFKGGEINFDKKADIGVALGSGKVGVNDQSKEEANILSNVYEEGRSDDVVENKGFEGGERINVYQKDRDGFETGVVLSDDEVVNDQREEEAKTSRNVCEVERSCWELDGEGMLSDEEEWDGIERSGLDMEFTRARDFVEDGEKEKRLAMADNDVIIMQLYGLQKVSMEGPCHEPQPMALKLTARAKWNAWQRLGNMSPEEAMEQYITLLSENVPEWMEDHSSVEIKSKSSKETVHSLPDDNISTSIAHRANERTSELSDLPDVSTSVNEV